MLRANARMGLGRAAFSIPKERNQRCLTASTLLSNQR